MAVRVCSTNDAVTSCMTWSVVNPARTNVRYSSCRVAAAAPRSVTGSAGVTESGIGGVSLVERSVLVREPAVGGTFPRLASFVGTAFGFLATLPLLWGLGCLPPEMPTGDSHDLGVKAVFGRPVQEASDRGGLLVAGNLFPAVHHARITHLWSASVSVFG